MKEIKKEHKRCIMTIYMGCEQSTAIFENIITTARTVLKPNIEMGVIPWCKNSIQNWDDKSKQRYYRIRANYAYLFAKLYITSYDIDPPHKNIAEIMKATNDDKDHLKDSLKYIIKFGKKILPAAKYYKKENKKRYTDFMIAGLSENTKSTIEDESESDVEMEDVNWEVHKNRIEL